MPALLPAGGIPIYDLVTAGNVEGGDFMVLKPGVAACGYSGERSIEPAVKQLQSWFEAEGWEFHTYAFDSHFLHLDVQMGMLAENLAVVCVEAVEPELVTWLRTPRHSRHSGSVFRRHAVGLQRRRARRRARSRARIQQESHRRLPCRRSDGLRTRCVDDRQRRWRRPLHVSGVTPRPV